MRKIVALFLVSIMIMGIGLTVNAGETKKGEISGEEYQSREKEYKEKIQELLQEMGVKNAGVMLTYRSLGEEDRVYTLSIHHKYLANDEEERVTKLKIRAEEYQYLLNENKIIWEINQF